MLRRAVAILPFIALIGCEQGRYRITAGGSMLNGAEEEIRTLVIPKSRGTGIVTIQRSF